MKQVARSVYACTAAPWVEEVSAKFSSILEIQLNVSEVSSSLQSRNVNFSIFLWHYDSCNREMFSRFYSRNPLKNWSSFIPCGSSRIFFIQSAKSLNSRSPTDQVQGTLNQTLFCQTATEKSFFLSGHCPSFNLCCCFNFLGKRVCFQRHSKPNLSNSPNSWFVLDYVSFSAIKE